MTDLNNLRAVLLASVPVDGNTIGNQSLLERVRGQIPQLTEEAFWAVRDGLIEEGVLAKGRGRGGAVKRVSGEPTSGSLAEQVLSKVRERMEPAAVAEASAAYVVETVAQNPTKVKAATSLQELEKTLWATADKLRANMDAAEYKHIVLGLIFLKYISDSFAGRRGELARKLTDENDDY
ncbi:SAM-dependent DNA methyltransferase [Pseudomonas sp. BN414]|nr:SAM-dependent DNA methyltransferase [Pseudomonas sp. BN414]